MGGFGSGGWNATGRATVDEHCVLDVGYLRRNRFLQDGALGQLYWTRAGTEPIAAIEVIGGRDSIHLRYGVRQGTSPSRVIDERVRLCWRPCPFGGERPLVTCPGCVRPVLKLHLAAGWFRCRHCHRLTYGSQRERERDRALRQANKLRRRLGGEPGMARPLPSRPRYMRKTTYGDQIEKIGHYEAAANDYAAAVLMRLYRRLPGRAKGVWS